MRNINISNLSCELKNDLENVKEGLAKKQNRNINNMPSELLDEWNDKLKEAEKIDNIREYFSDRV